MTPFSDDQRHVSHQPIVRWDAEAQASEPLILHADFPKHSPAEWRRIAEEDLAGADFEKKLVWRPLEGIDVQPLCTREDVAGLGHLGGLPGFPPYGRGAYPLSGVRPPWQVRQECALPTPEEANAALRDGLARGQTAVGLRLDDAARAGFDGDSAEAIEQAGRHGTTLSSINGLRIALADIDLEKVPVAIRTGRAALAVLAMLIALARERGVSPAALTGTIEHDPLQSLVRCGRSKLPMEAEYRIMSDMVRFCARECPGIRPVVVNAGPYHNAGASAVQELGCAMGVAVEYVRELGARGIDAGMAARAMTFSFSVGTNLFIEIAKLRAARLLWAKVAKTLGAPGPDEWRMEMHARTSAATKSALDPHNNLLRSAVEAFAAAVGGADSLHVAPFDELLGPADEFPARLARNQQLLLQEEAHLAKVVDPAGGSYHVEALTDSLARAAWKFFQGIEAAGGMTKALLAGKPQSAIRETAARRAKLVASRRQPIVGVSVWPDPNEPPLPGRVRDRAGFLAERRRRLARLKSVRRNSAVRELLGALTQSLESGQGNLVESGVAAAAEGATIGEFSTALLAAVHSHGIGIESLRPRRAAAPFEELRERMAAHRDLSGGRVGVRLVTTGPAAMRRARADFSAGFFGIAGFEVVDDSPATSPESAADAALGTNDRIFVLCSDDATYPVFAPPFVQRLKAARAHVLVVVAGWPEEHVEALKQAGVDDFVHIRADAVETLGRIMDKVGIAK